MIFHSGAIDLVTTWQNYCRAYGDKRLRRKHFGLPIVRLAYDTLVSHSATAEELEGVEACLIALSLRLKWRTYLFGIPLGEEHPFHCDSLGTPPWDRELATLLVESLMLTMTAYREQLQEFHTGAAPIVYTDVLMGFQLVCLWMVERRVPLNPKENDLIVLLDVRMLAQHLGV